MTTNQIQPRILSIFVGIGDLFLQTGRQARGIELLMFALHHPSGHQDTKDRARRLLNRYPASQPLLTNVDFHAVTAALLDELLMPDHATLTRQTPQVGESLIEPLSERELAVLALIVDGLSNREIADKLFLSIATVKWYLTHIYGKLGVESRTQAIMRARQLNLLP